MKTSAKIVLFGAIGVLAVGITLAQNYGGGGFGGGGYGGRRGGRGGYGGGYKGAGSPDEPLISTEGPDSVVVNEDTVRTARETARHSTEMPNWTNKPGFEKDVFTFARVLYKWNSTDPRLMNSPGMVRWINDYPDADLNLSFRLQQLTSMNVDPDARVIKLMDPDLFNYPFIYMVKPLGLELRDEEVPILRKYLENGGVLMADDFWGDTQWENFETQMKRVLPNRAWQELPIDHPIFHSVFNIKVDKSKLQVPSIHRWERSRDAQSGQYGGWLARRGDGDPSMHVRAWLDDKGRIMIIATHNTDNGDGWEREGEDHEYFQIFSEQRAYPLGINIIFYCMTH